MFTCEYTSIYDCEGNSVVDAGNVVSEECGDVKLLRRGETMFRDL
jgi:hypothetical protein